MKEAEEKALKEYQKNINKKFDSVKKEGKKKEKEHIQYEADYEAMLRNIKTLTDQVTAAYKKKKSQKDRVTDRQYYEYMKQLDELLTVLEQDGSTKERKEKVETQQVVREMQVVTAFQEKARALIPQCNTATACSENDISMLALVTNIRSGITERENKKKSQLTAFETEIKDKKELSEYEGLEILRDLMKIEPNMYNDKSVRSLLESIQSNGTLLAKTVGDYYAPVSEKEPVKTLSYEELEKLKTLYGTLVADLEKFPKEKQIENERFKKTEEAHRKAIDKAKDFFTKEIGKLTLAMNDIDKRMGKEDAIKMELRPYSLYDIQGKISPNFYHGFMGKYDTFRKTLRKYEDYTKKLKNNNVDSGDLREIGHMVGKIAEVRIPDYFELGKEGDAEYIKTLKPSEVEDLRDEFYETSVRLYSFYRLNLEKAKTVEEKEFGEAVKAMYLSLRETYLLLDYLSPKEGISEMEKDMAEINRKVDERKKAEKEGKKLDEKVVEQQKRLEEQATNRLTKGSTYRLLLDNDQLYVQSLFEEPGSNREIALTTMRGRTQRYAGARKNFDAMMAQDSRYMACPDLDVIRDVLSINETTQFTYSKQFLKKWVKDQRPRRRRQKDENGNYLPLLPEPPVTDEEIAKAQEDLQKMVQEEIPHLQISLQSMMQDILPYYVEGADGKTKYLTRPELEKLTEKYFDIEDEIKTCRRMIPDGTAEAVKLDDLYKRFFEHSANLSSARHYISTYANEGSEDTLAPFTIYEIQGTVNPDIDDNAGRDIEEMKHLGDKVAGTMSKYSNRELRKLMPIMDEYRAFVKSVDHLY